jgi:hypothetical protein
MCWCVCACASEIERRREQQSLIFKRLCTELGAHSLIDREEKDSQGFIHKPTDHDD